MSVYTVIYAIFSALGLTVRRNQEWLILFLMLVFLLMFMGTRFEVGCDWAGYHSRYNNIPVYASMTEAFGKAEPAFSLIEYFVKTGGLSFMWINLIATAIMLGCYWIFLRNIHYPILVLALLFPIMMMQLGMSGIRQGIAVGFLLVAMTLFMKGHRLSTALVILLGSQFHLSAVIFLPLAFLAGREFDIRYVIAGALLLSPLAIFVIGDRVELYQTRYVDEAYGDQSSGGAVFRYALNLVPAILFVFFRKRLKENFPDEYTLMLLFAIATIAMVPLAALSTFALHRLNFYVMPFTIMMGIYLVMSLETWRDRMLAILIPIGAYGAYSVAWQQLSFHYGYCYSDYQSYLQA